MKKLLIKIGVIAGIAIAMTACYPGGAEYTSDTDIILTNYNPDFNFKSVQTYYLSDSISFIAEDTTETINGEIAKQIIDELERNFDARGYTRLFPEDSIGPPPNVSVVVSVIKVKNYQVYGGYPWYGGWGWGWGWYKSTNYYGYPGYGWGYPYYPTYVTSYETGTVKWDMFDPDNVDEEEEIIYVEWTGALNGVLGSSVSNTQTRITNGIDQAFRQSPYLQSE